MLLKLFSVVRLVKTARRALSAALFGVAVFLGSTAQGQTPPQPAPVAAPSATVPAPAVAPVPDPAQAGGVTPAPPPAEAAPAELPRDLTPLGMFMSADIIVKAVMLGLVFASVLTWTIWLAKTAELIAARRRLARAHDVLETTHTLAEAARPASQASPIITAFTTRSASRYMPTSESFCGRRSPPTDGSPGAGAATTKFGAPFGLT